MAINREQLIKNIIVCLKKNTFHIKSYVLDELLENGTFNEYVDLIYDASLENILYLSKRDTYILRKRLGIYDNGKMQSYKVISDSLDSPLSDGRIYDILSHFFWKFSFKLSDDWKKINSVLLTIQNTINNSCKLNINSFNLINLSKRSYNLLSVNNIKTINDLIKLNTDDILVKVYSSHDGINEVINFVHNNGLLFADEVEILKLYSEYIHKHLGGQFDPEVFFRYNNLVIEKLQLMEQEEKLNEEIIKVLMQMDEKDIQMRKIEDKYISQKEGKNGQAKK